MVIETHRLNAGQFAEKIGVQRSNVSHILSGRNKPGYEFLEKVLLAFPRVQADWLMTGRQSKSAEPMADKEIMVVKEEDPAPYGNSSSGTLKKTGKEVVKIVTFYSDYTFDTFLPNAE